MEMETVASGHAIPFLVIFVTIFLYCVFVSSTKGATPETESEFLNV
jgi:hypothetical protein